MTAAVHANQATMEVNVIKLVLKTVLITHVLLLMDLVSVEKDIMVCIVQTSAWMLVKPVLMRPSVQCVVLVDTDHLVLLTVTVTAVHVISLLDCVMYNMHVLHSVPRVLSLVIVRRVRRGCMVLSVVRHAPVVVMADVKSTLERVLSVTLDIMDPSVISSAKGAPISVAIRTEHATIVRIHMFMG